jgi:hypothetical protein
LVATGSRQKNGLFKKFEDLRDLGAGNHARVPTSSLTPFDCEENLSERPRGFFARPIPRAD